jgi:5-methyltetrahydrofolate--homocysteine methyltransferase
VKTPESKGFSLHLHEFKSVELTQRAQELITALEERVVIADGAMGTMLQDRKPTLEDFEGHEGCNEILNVTRPDIILDVHNAYF